MKKILILLLACALFAALIGCVDSKGKDKNTAGTVTSEATATATPGVTGNAKDLPTEGTVSNKVTATATPGVTGSTKDLLTEKEKQEFQNEINNIIDELKE